MAVMGSRKQMVRRLIENQRSKSKEREKLERQRIKDEPLTEEEHQKRLKILKDMGLVK